MLAAGCQRLLEFEADIALAALDLGELINKPPRAAIEVVHDGLTLSVEAEPGLSLLVCADPIIRDKPAEMRAHEPSAAIMRGQYTVVYKVCNHFPVVPRLSWDMVRASDGADPWALIGFAAIRQLVGAVTTPQCAGGLLASLCEHSTVRYVRAPWTGWAFSDAPNFARHRPHCDGHLWLGDS